MFNKGMGNLYKQAQKMQKNINKVQEELKDLKVEGSAGGEMVIITVNGKNGVTATFTHDSAIAAYDRNYLQVNNDELESPAACKDFAQKLFRANLETQYEYGIDTFEGAHLSENDIVRVETEDVAFAGNYRVRGKRIQFDENNMAIGISINRKPPTLAEFISRQDN